MQGVRNDLEQLAEDSGRQPMAETQRSSRWFWLATVPVVLLVVLLGIYWSNLSQSESEGPTPQLALTAEDWKSIAVLPFDNLSPNRDDEYFSDGMTEEIIATLTKIGGLKVISRTSVMRYKDSEKGLREIAKELGVATILEGSARQAEGRVRITAQLIDARADEPLWAETYERELEGIFAIQSDVALQIAGALKAELSPAEKNQIEKKPTENVQAYDLFLMGRHFRNIESPSENLKRAVDYYEQAIREDPDFAEAYAGLAEAIFLLAYYEPGGEWTGDRAEAELQRALQLDESIAAAHVMKGTFSWAYHIDFAGAVREYERAIELDPTLVNAHREYGLFLFRQCGILDEALLKLQEALRQDPLSPLINDHLHEFYMASGEIEEAIEAGRKVVELAPGPAWGYLNSGHLHLLFGGYEEAELKAQKVLQIDTNSYAAEWLLALTYLCQRRMVEASEVSRRRLSAAPNHRHWAIAGIVALWEGNHADARTFLEKAVELKPTGTVGSSLYWPAHWRYSTVLAYILWKSGDHEEAEELLSDNLRLDNPQRIESGAETAAPYRLYDIAMIYAIRGETEEAYGWLQKAIDAGWRYYDITSQDPVWSAFHGEARFQQMMAEVKAKVDVMRARVREMEKEWEIAGK
jgi:TolB-like protein/Tfp pilus assembly protein PilF